MADDDEDDENTEGEGEGGGSKKKLIILGAIFLVLVIASVVGTIMALDMFSGAEDEMVESEMIDTEIEVDDTPKPAIYYPLKPPLIVNFQARGRQRFLQAELTLLVRDEAVVQAIETHMPMIRNSMVMLFSGQTYEDLQTPDGKDILRQQALDEVQRVLEEETGEPGVEQVLFTNFVMQ